MCALLCGVGFVSVAPGADRKARPIRFLYRLTPGREFQFNISEQRVIRTTVGSHEERLVWGRTGTWTIYFAAGDANHPPMVAQQMALAAGHVIDYQRNGRKAQPDDPEVVGALLPAESCQLLTRSVKSSAVPVVLPSSKGLERLLYRLALDHLSWPTRPVEIGFPFQDALDWDGLSAERVRRVAKAGRVGERRRATVHIAIDGEFADRYAGRPKLQLAATILQWDLSNQALLGMVSEVRYARRRGGTTENVSLRFSVERAAYRSLTPAQQQTTRDALIELAALISMRWQKQAQQVVGRAEKFREKYGSTVWLPMADFLAGHAGIRKKARGPLAPEPLVRALRAATITWQSAMQTEDLMREELGRRSFEELVRRNRADLLALAGGNDVTTRAMATFALGFGTAPADLVTIERSAGHEHPRVRAWAAYALAMRAGPDVSRGLLARLLADEDPNVRTRACQAVGACVGPSAEEAGPFRKRIIERLADQAATVRRQAAEALATIGTAADALPIQEAMANEQDAEVRDVMAQALEKLAK